MLQRAYKRYCAVEKMLETDEEYKSLMDAHNALEPAFCKLLDSLDEEQRSIITEHTGLCAEMAERTVQIACFLP